MQILGIVFDVAMMVIGVIVIGYLKELPALHKELKLQEKEHSHQHTLQQEAYYKQVSGDKIEELFVQWTEMFVDMNKLKTFDTKQALEISQKVFLYGSSNTIELYAKYLNELYTEKSSGKLGEYRTQYSLYMFADILAHLKYDFTGYMVDPLVFLKAKITDYDVKFTEEILKEIKKFITTLK